MKKLSKIEISFLLGFVIVCICMFCIDYFFHVESELKNERVVDALKTLDSLKKSEKWPEVVALSESLLATENKLILTEQQRFDVINQLISTYFFLGNFEKANYHATSLLALAHHIQQPDSIAASLYKFSAVLRAEAGKESSLVNQKHLFEEARNYANMALQLCLNKCPNYKSLKAKILFNAAAVEAEAPDGNLAQAINMYQEALPLFKTVQDDSYYQRTLIRLAKAYLLQGELDPSWQIVEQLKQLTLSQRTFMHFCYLQAQVLQAKKLDQEALQVAQQGKEIAQILHAEVDLQRFNALTDSLNANL